ncbi:MAG TPA: hypothetical protein VGF16_14700 [Bryobacteraceae bacterium]
MKKYFLFLLLALAGILPSRAETISLDAPSQTSGFFDVFVNLTDVFSAPHDADFFLAYGFDVSFDNSIVSYLGETPGALFTDLSANPGITAEVAGDATNILLGPGDFTEPLNLAVLHFETIGVGPTTITISGDISNLDQGLIYLTGSDPISASASFGVPEPSALWLLSLSLLIPLRRRWIG